MLCSRTGPSISIHPDVLEEGFRRLLIIPTAPHHGIPAEIPLLSPIDWFTAYCAYFEQFRHPLHRNSRKTTATKYTWPRKSLKSYQWQSTSTQLSKLCGFTLSLPTIFSSWQSAGPVGCAIHKSIYMYFPIYLFDATRALDRTENLQMYIPVTYSTIIYINLYLSLTHRAQSLHSFTSLVALTATCMCWSNAIIRLRHYRVNSYSLENEKTTRSHTYMIEFCLR